MGQSWLMMAPKVEEVVNFSGKIGEMLFDGSAKALVELLAVPVHDADLIKTARQNDDICVGSPSAKRKIEEVLQEQPASDSKRPRVQRGSELKLSDAKGKRTDIHNLATELHDLIFDHLDIVDIFSLSISNRHFWSIGRKRIRAYFMSFMGPWANQSIVCVGEDITAGDYPPGMFTDDEEAELRQSLDGYGQPMTLWYLHEDFFNIRASVSLPTTLLGQLLDDDKDYYRKELGSYWTSVRTEVYPDLSSFYPKDQPWILRNLTTREYVRSEAIALEPEHIHGPCIDFIGFGEVVLSRICWSTGGSSTSMSYDGDIERGVWAGHCFDITTLARHNRETKEDGWSDVSEEVAIEIAKIWESEYGSGWRQIVTGDRRI